MSFGVKSWLFSDPSAYTCSHMCTLNRVYVLNTRLRPWSILHLIDVVRMRSLRENSHSNTLVSKVKLFEPLKKRRKKLKLFQHQRFSLNFPSIDPDSLIVAVESYCQLWVKWENEPAMKLLALLNIFICPYDTISIFFLHFPCFCTQRTCFSFISL